MAGPAPGRARRGPPLPLASVGFHSRARRRDVFLEHFPNLAEMSVLDLGGTAAWWRQAAVRPKSVTLVNLKGRDPVEPWISFVRADACEPPRDLGASCFDLVFSNSLIEHVGGHQRRALLADVVHRLGSHHWVQTPYRYFPVEPHWMFPGFQFLPATTRARISQRWKLGHVKAAGADRRKAMESVLEVELLSAAELAYYFPGSEIVRERFWGMTKALIAVV